MLPEYLRVLQGDGISYETLKSVLEGIEGSGWSTENLVFGSGGALLQKLDRDTQKCAFKCSFAVVNGKPVTLSRWCSMSGHITDITWCKCLALWNS